MIDVFDCPGCDEGIEIDTESDWAAEGVCPSCGASLTLEGTGECCFHLESDEPRDDPFNKEDDPPVRWHRPLVRYIPPAPPLKISEMSDDMKGLFERMGFKT